VFDYSKALRWFAEHFEEVLGASLLAAMAILAMVNVVTRYVIQLPLAFTEELEVNAMVWLTLLGSAAAFRKQKHLKLLFFIQKLSPFARTVVERLISLMSAGLFVTLGYLGYLMLLDERFLEITSESLGYPQWIYTVAIPFGCLLVVIRIIQAEWRRFRGDS
jgi:TRAP-type C4-dicarboxylate transport system permease small subunit